MQHRLIFTAAAAGILLTGGTAQAETAAAANSLDEIVVTASKREEKLHDVAMSISAIGGEDLARYQISGFTELAAQIPGLSIEGVDPGRIRVVLRGQNVGGVGATIATTVDDIPFFMSGSQSNGAFFSANIDTYDLQRVEVLRGPQGTLYGASAEGGLIKYVTNLPDLTAYHGGVSVGGEGVDGGQSAGSVKGFVNIPFWDNKAALRISAVEEGIPGWVDNPSSGQSDVNHGDKHSLRGSLLVQPTPELTIRVTGFSQALSIRNDNNVQVVGAALAPSAPPADQFDPVNGFNNATAGQHLIKDNLSYYALHLQYDFNFATLVSATSYGKITKRYTTDVTDLNLAPGFTLADALGGLYGEPIVAFGNQEEFLHKFNEEVRLASNPGFTLFGHGFDWQGGVFFTREITSLDQHYVAHSAADPATVLDPPLGGTSLPADYKETAVFVDMTYHFSKAFDLEFGGRNTGTKQHSQATTLCCILIGAEDHTFDPISTSETSRTWSVAPRWHLNDDTMIYARIATGFSPGGPNNPSSALTLPPPYRSDSTRNYEVGLRTDLFDKRFSIDVDIFDVKWKDVQILEVVDTPSGPVGINGNGGSAESKGVEWNFQWRPVQGLSLGLLGAYTNAKLTSDAPILGGASGEKLPYVPELSSTLNVDYTWHAFGNYLGFVGGSGTYTGTRYTSFSSSAVTSSHVKLPTYTALHLQAGLDNGHYSVEVFGSNLGNARGITEYANSGGQNQTGLASFIQPRTIGIELGAKF
jgi:iron complex outermembrane receptor protein